MRVVVCGWVARMDIFLGALATFVLLLIFVDI